jgi:hypothetical protein
MRPAPAEVYSSFFPQGSQSVLCDIKESGISVVLAQAGIKIETVTITAVARSETGHSTRRPATAGEASHYGICGNGFLQQLCSNCIGKSISWILNF